jgi:cellobiose-specific phosphotransferase system component IIC
MQIPPISSEGVLVIILWSLLWKAPALWRAARRGDKKWYGVILVIGFLGILEYIYLFVVSKDKKEKEKTVQSHSPKSAKTKSSKE